jgi:hypothetical protein
MKSSPFRSPDEWKSAMMTLPDNTYFELMRSIFGNVKTPFNKQRLMEDLASLFTREEIRKTIAAYIDERDHRLIAALALLNEPVPADLECFFAGEFSAAEIRIMLLNLEERFLVYRFRDEGVYRLALNPMLEKILAPFIADTGVLFASFPEKPGEDGKNGQTLCPLDDRVLAALFAFVPEKGDFFKAEGGLRKRIFDAGQILFPGLPLESLIGGFQILGLFRMGQEGLFPDTLKPGAFGKLSRRERLEYCAAGVYAYRNGTESSAASGGIPGYFPQSYLKNLVFFIHRFLDTLEPRRRYPKSTLQRFVMLLEREEPAFGAGQKASPRYHFNGLFEVMELTGLLEAAGPDLWQTGPVLADPPPGPAAGEIAPGDAPLPEQPVLAMDTAFSFFLYPEIAFADALTLAGFCSVRETGSVVCFELTRQSVVRGFDRGMNAAAMTELLNRLSGSRIDKNTIWTIQEWEARHDAISLYQGVVLTLAEDRRYLAETGPLASLVSRTLAPGIYLLSVQKRIQAVELLEKAGVDIIAQPGGMPDRAEPERTFFPVPESASASGPNRVQQERFFAGRTSPPEVQPDSAGAEDYKERFRAILKKLELPRAEREELAARIERRLVVSESQLAEASVRYEKLEARGLDYVGKAAIAKQAIASKSLLEVLWPHPNGGTNKALGVPEALEKRGGESILIIKPLSPEDSAFKKTTPEEPGRAEPIRLPLGKISLLRRIKQSIFGE